METRVLVAYATRNGATAGIAQRIGETLRAAGLVVDVQLTDKVQDVNPYQAVVLGSAVYIGRWRKEAAKFLQANELVLARKQVWLFSSGPLGEGDAVELAQGWRFPSNLQPVVDRIQPRDVMVFHGAVDPQKLNFIERWMLKKVKSPVGDFRNWDAVDAWAAGIAQALRANEQASGTQEMAVSAQFATARQAMR